MPLYVLGCFYSHTLLLAMASIAHQVLYDKEEELVHVLSLKGPVEIAINLFKKCVISDTMWDLFASLDHSSVEPQLEIRYLLRLVHKRLEDDGTVWDKFLNLLAGMGSWVKLRRWCQEITVCLWEY